MANTKRNIRAVYGDDYSVKLYDKETGDIISNLGRYSIMNAETGDIVKSVRFNGSNSVHILNEDGKILHTVLVDSNHRVMSLD